MCAFMITFVCRRPWCYVSFIICSLKSCKQLKRLLVTMAMYSQDYGTSIVQHLLGFSPHERIAGSASQSTVPVSTMTLDLLYQLCVPTSDENKQRFVHSTLYEFNSDYQ